MADDIFDCLDRAIADGHITRELVEQYEQRLTEVMDDTGLEAGSGGFRAQQKAAAEKVLSEFERRLARKKRSAVFQSKVQKKVDDRFDGPGGPGGGGAGPGQVGMSFLQFDRKGEVHGPNVLGRYNQLRQENGAALVDYIQTFRSRRAGLKVPGEGKQKDVLEDTVRALHGEEGVSPDAKAFADAYTNRRDKLITRFNMAGGDVQKRKRWALPQRHDKAAIQNRMQQKKIKPADWKNGWVEFMAKRVHMFTPDGDTMSARDLRGVLGSVYDDIMSNGRSELGKRLEGSPVNKRVNGREIHFNSADDWLEYNREFGSEDIFRVMMADLDRLTKDVATLEVLGPYPDATIRHIQDRIRSSKQDLQNQGEKVKRGSLFTKDEGGIVQRMWDVYSGRSEEPISQGLANLGDAARATQTGALLGSATISALVDTGTMLANAKFSNLPATRMFWNMIKQLNPRSRADREFAARLGFIADTWLNDAHASMRVMNQGFNLTSKAGRFFDKSSNAVIRGSGLTVWTDAGRNAFRLTMLSELTGEAIKKSKFANLPSKLKDTLERYNIGDKEWRAFKATKQFEMIDQQTGEILTRGNFIRPNDIYEQLLEVDGIDAETLRFAFDTSSKFADMIDSEAYRAVVIPDLRARAALTFGSQAGTLGGEALRSFAQFKSFPVALVGLQFARIFSSNSSGKRLSYAATVGVGMLTMALLAEWASQVVKGQTPTNPFDDDSFSLPDVDELADADSWGEDWDFAWKVINRAGFLGLMGDFLTSQRYNHGISDLLGPLGSAADKVGELVVGTATDLIEEAETEKLGSRLVDVIKQFTPGQSLWYGRKLFEEAVLDTVEWMIDGDAAEDRWERLEERLDEEGRKLWWRKGAFTGA